MAAHVTGGVAEVFGSGLVCTEVAGLVRIHRMVGHGDFLFQHGRVEADVAYLAPFVSFMSMTVDVDGSILLFEPDIKSQLVGWDI
jgi:hypothetical protein